MDAVEKNRRQHRFSFTALSNSEVSDLLRHAGMGRCYFHTAIPIREKAHPVEAR